MNILLVARNTLLNSLVRKTTNSDWGHSSVVINGLVYEFDVNEKSKQSLTSVLESPSILKASMFHLDMLGGEREANESYSELFDIGLYDIRALYTLKYTNFNKRNHRNIQSSRNLYTCSNLIAKACRDHFEQVGLSPDFSKDFHWSQTIPDDYSELDEINLVQNE